MPDIQAVNGVSGADVQAVNGVGVADIQTINGLGVPSGATTATRWVMAHDDRYISTITNSDVLAGNNWASYDSFSGGSSPNPSSGNDHIHIAYGKDGSGNALWVSSYATDGCELAYHDDPTSGPWTGVNTDSSGNNLPNRVFALQWGNDVWVAVGKMGTQSILRSTDGAAWAQVDVSGVTGINGTAIYALAGTGSGTWWFAQENRIYQSTNDGSSWALLHTLVNSNNADPGNIRALQYTNNTLFAGVDAGDATIYAAAAADLTDWSNETTLSSSAYAFDQQTHVASAAGRIVVVGHQKKWTMDVSGKSITVDEDGVDFSGDNTAHGTLSSVSTDGSTWVATCFTGDTFVSTNGGDSWTAGQTNVASKDALDNAPDVYLPL